MALGHDGTENRLSICFHQLISCLLEKALEASGDDLDSAIKSLNELRLESTGFKSENGQHTVIQPSVEGCFLPKTLVFL